MMTMEALALWIVSGIWMLGAYTHADRRPRLALACGAVSIAFAVGALT